MTNVVSRTRKWLAQEGRAYGREPGVLSGYAALIGAYGAGTGAAIAAARATGRARATPPTPWELIQLAAATHKLSRILTKDAVTSPLRAPFTTWKGSSAPGEVAEEVREHGIGHSVGELLTCPLCVAQWIATAFAAGLVLAPTLTRAAITVFSTVAGSDLLQHAYVALQQQTE